MNDTPKTTSSEAINPLDHNEYDACHCDKCISEALAIYDDYEYDINDNDDLPW